MVVISKITTQKNNEERFNIFITRGGKEEFAFGVDQDVLIKFGLRKGLEIDEQEIHEVLFEDEIKKAVNLAVQFLSYRMRSEKEVRDYLQKKEISEEAVPQVIEKLLYYNYLDDLEFAKAFVRTRKRTTVKGPYLIRQELIEKGISEDNLVKALKEYSFEEQVDNAFQFAEKKQKQASKTSASAFKQKMNGTLRGKGFSGEVIEIVLNELPEQDENEEWEALKKQGIKAHNRYKKYTGFEYERRMKQYLYGKGFPFPLIERFLNEEEE
ncbi:recombination regulator RecX [Bacillus taeanensis]|uniref:Regulatory protein RecX n=1 Tax=Bacillus taeanensis TaxID=273032 RepID=A0A366XTQ9_9BACI|nr:recombination regulator RecX [Bacillus taeanensis]RBW68139.1 recombination regulator RecX [Bacillus taeanensis]